MLRWLLDLFRTAPSAASGASPPPQAAAEPEPPPPFLRREALLDRDQQLAAYVFSIETPAALEGHAWQASTRKFFDGALIDHFAGGHLAGLLDRRLAFLPLSPASLAHPRLAALPPRNLVIELTPASGAPPDSAHTLARLGELRQRGFQIACGHEPAQHGAPEILELASYINLGDVAHMDPPDLLALCHRYAERYPEAGLVARGINSMELYEACRKMGIRLYQGDFLTRRKAAPGSKIAPYRMFVVKLLNGLRDQADFEDLAAIAWCDPALGYRLLNFVNSAAFGLREKVDRLSRAMAFVGRDELLRWLTLLLFTSQEPNPLDEALRENALIRARLAETLAGSPGNLPLTRRQRDEVFVVGILSVIDALLEMPMAEALASLNLPEPVKAALLTRQGPYAPYLELAIACEQADQDTIRTLAGQCGMDALTVNQQHIQALAWSMDFLDTLS